MTTVLRDLTTLGNAGNTGVQQYVFDPSLIKGIVLVPTDWEANTAYLDTMIASLQADTVKAEGNRIYPIFRFGAMEDKSSEEKTIVLGYGDAVNGAEGKYGFRFEVIGGGVDLQKELKKFNGPGRNVLLVDDNDVIIGTSTANADEMGGMTCNIRAIKPKYPDGTNNTKYLLDVTLSNTKEAFDNMVIYKSSVSIEQNVKGCLNVTLADNGTQSTTHIFISAKTNQGLVNLYDTFDDELADPNAWSILEADGVTPIIPSGVAKVAGTKGWDLTGVYATGTTISVNLASPSALRTLLIGVAPGNGFESATLELAIP